MKSTLFALLIMSLSAVRGDDIVLTDGTVYKDARIAAHTPSTVSILYADGGTTIPISRLPKPLQVQLGYSPQAAADYDKRQALSDAAAERAVQEQQENALLLAKARKLVVKVYQVLNDHEVLGTIGNDQVRVHIGGIDLKNVQIPASLDPFGGSIPARPADKIVEDRFYQFTVWPDGTYRYDTTIGASSQIESYTSSLDEARKGLPPAISTSP